MGVPLVFKSAALGTILICICQAARADPPRPDLAVSGEADPALATVGQLVSLHITVTNQGTAAAEQVDLVGSLSTQVSFFAATASQGVCTQNLGVVTCSLGEIPRDSSAEVHLTVTAETVGAITNHFVVSSADRDLDPNNDANFISFLTGGTTFDIGPNLIQSRAEHQATLLPDGRVLIVGGRIAFSHYAIDTEILDPARVAPPTAIYVSDASVAEGNSGTRTASFEIVLSKAMGWPVSVEAATYQVHGSAASSGVDYVHTNRHVAFPPGNTSQWVDVTVFGDVEYETDEQFWLRLSSPTNALLADSVGVGRILDEDDPPTLFGVASQVPEGHLRSTNTLMEVRLSGPSFKTTSVLYNTTNDTAMAGQDYVATNGVLSFSPGVTSRFASVDILGDIDIENDESFELVLHSPSNTSVVGNGVVTIVNDDGLPGDVYQFTVSPESVPMYTGIPHPFVISATDADGVRVSGFTNWVALQTHVPQSPGHYSGFEEGAFGVWNPLENVTVPGPYYFESVDVDGDGEASMAFGLTPDRGVPDGIEREVELVAGTPYAISANCAVGTVSRGGVGSKTTIRLFVDDTEIDAHAVALDPFDGVVSNYAATIALSAFVPNRSPPVPVTSPTEITFSNGVWAGAVHLAGANEMVTLVANDGLGHFGISDEFALLPHHPLEVIVPPLLDEGSGELADAGSLRIGVARPWDIQVSVSNDRPGAVHIPTELVMPAGQTNLPFDVTVPDNLLLDGTRTLNVTASAPFHATSVVHAVVLDNEFTTLSLSVPTVVEEGSGIHTG